MAVTAARHMRNPTQPAHAIPVAVGVYKGILHRDPSTKYAVAFRRISILSLALASSLRSGLFSASSSLTGRLGTATLPPSDGDACCSSFCFRTQLPIVEIGIPGRRAASC